MMTTDRRGLVQQLLHRSMQTTKQHLHLAGIVFRDESDALERRLLGELVRIVVPTGRNRRW